LVRTLGLDVHKRFTEVAVHEGGEVRSLGRVETCPEQLRLLAGSLGRDDHVVIESTSLAWPVAALFAEHVGKVTVSNPLRTRAIASAKVKTDKVDARTLAELAAAGVIAEVWAPDEATRALRRRNAHRARLVRQRTRLRNQVHALLVRNLVAVEVSDVFGKAGRRLLGAVELPADERAQLESTLRLHDVLCEEIVACERPLAEQALESAELLAGLRIGEALALRWRDVELLADPPRLLVSRTWDPASKPEGAERRGLEGPVKNGEEGIVTIGRRLFEALLDHKAASSYDGDDDLVFPSATGDHSNPANIRQRVLQPAIVRANAQLTLDKRPLIPAGVTPHSLRHTYCSLLIAQGEELPTVAAQMRHADISTTLRVYTHVMKHRREGVAERLDEALWDAEFGRDQNSGHISVTKTPFSAQKHKNRWPDANGSNSDSALDSGI
jgi:integrase